MTKIAVTGFRGVPATWGGIEHHCENLYARLAQRGYDITIYARNYYTPENISEYKGMRIKHLPTINYKYSDALLHTLISVIHILFTNPDIIHIHGIGPCFFSWIPRLFKPRIKVFFTCHGLDWQRKKWPWWASKLMYLGELNAVYFAQHHIVVSKNLQEYFSKAHHISAHYIPNGIAIQPLRPPHAIKRWGLYEHSYFLCVGRMVPEKRIEDIIRAYLLKPRKCSLVIVGDNAASGRYMSELRNIAGSNPAILFTGYQFGAILEELYSSTAAFIAASELEGLPITLLEALSYGAMCVTSNIAPHRELMEPLHGICFPVGDVYALASSMDWVETMSEYQRERFRENAISMISRHFSWNYVCNAHHLLYQKALSTIEP